MTSTLVSPAAPEQASSSKAAVRTLFRCPDLTPHLVPLERAVPGDIVAMVGGHRANLEEGSLEVDLEVFYVQGETTLEVAWYDQVPAPAADHAAHIVAEQLFLARRPHDVLLAYDTVEDSVLYHVQSVHFADAILYVNREWLEGDLYDEDLDDVRPVLFMMEGATDPETARDRAAKARKYIEVVRRMLPARFQDEPDWDRVLPGPEAFLRRPAR